MSIEPDKSLEKLLLLGEGHLHGEEIINFFWNKAQGQQAIAPVKCHVLVTFYFINIVLFLCSIQYIRSDNVSHSIY